MALDFAKLAEELSANEKPVATRGQYVGNSALAGAADTVGGLLDTPARLYNLAKAQAGIGPVPSLLSMITGRDKSDFMPEVSMEQANYVSNKLKGLLGVDETMQAPDSTTRYLGAGARGATGAVLSGPASGVKGAAEIAKSLLGNAAVGTAAGIGSEGGGDAAEAMGGPRAVGQVLGGLGAGVGYASGGGAIGAAFRTKQLLNELENQAKDPKTMEAAAKTASTIVNSKLKAAVEGTPNAAQNIDEALALRAKIPGFNPSVPEMAGAKGALEMQRVYARNSPKALNEEVARVAASEQALKDYYGNVAPAAGQAGNVRSAVNQSLSDEGKALAAQAQGTAGRLPTADLVGLGNKAAEIAAAEKAAARPGITAAYQKAYDLAPDAAIPTQPILSKIEEVLGMPMSQIKPETAPNTFNAIKRFLGAGDDAVPGNVLGRAQAEMNALGGPPKAAPTQTMTLEEAHNLRKAVSADATLAANKNSPLAATGLRNILEVKTSVDEAITNSPIAEAAKNALKAADNKYKTEFVPRFGEGTNRLMFKDGVNNEPRIIADKFVDSYFKSDQQGGGTRAENFKQLFGASREAKDLMREGVLDRFRTAAVNPETGILDPTKAANFMRQHGRTLDTFKSNGVNAVDDIKQFSQVAAKQEQATNKLKSLSSSLKFENVDDLANAALKSPKVMGNVLERLPADTKETFTRALMDKAMAGGTGKSLNTFLDDNKDTLKMVLKPDHETALRDIAKGLSIMEQSPVKGLAGSNTTDPLKSATGVSMATVWSQWRAMTGGRQGVATMGFNLATPVFTKLSQTKFDDVMKTALHDPKTAENLRNFLQANTQQQASNFAERLWDGLKTVGSVGWQSKGAVTQMLLNTKEYPKNLKRTIPAINTEIQGDEP